MDVSIILLTCNSGDTISECIDYIDISIKESKLLCELIIVDANSLDNTLSILKKKAIHTEIISTEINDRSYSFNEGVSKATGKYICRVDSRSLLPKEHIIKCKTPFALHVLSQSASQEILYHIFSKENAI